MSQIFVDGSTEVDGVMRVGVFPGSFDPVHNGHLNLMHTFLDDHTIDQVWIYINSLNALHKKRSMTAYEHRLEMLLISLTNEVWSCRVRVISPDFFPPLPSFGDGRSDLLFPILFEKLRALTSDKVNFYLLRGSDYFRGKENGYEYPASLKIYPHLIGIRDEAALAYDYSYLSSYVLKSTEMCSSTLIKRDPDAFEHLLPQDVQQYCRKHKLYQFSNL